MFRPITLSMGLICALLTVLPVIAESSDSEHLIANETLEITPLGQPGAPEAAQVVHIDDATAVPAELEAETVQDQAEIGLDLSLDEESYSTDRRLSLQFGENATQRTGRSIQEEISIDLMDIRPFREALEPGESTPKLRLGLEACIQIALQQNPEIIIATFDPLSAESDIDSARGIFDPVFSTAFTHSYADISASQTNVAFGGISSIENYQSNLRASLDGMLSYGTQYTLNFDSNMESTTYGQFINEYDATMGLSLTQPLLRGFGKNFNTVSIRSAEKARDVSEAQLRMTVLSTVSEVTKAYWELVGAIENLRVREESLANAQRLLEINEIRRDIGSAADIEVLQAKAGVAARQGDVVQARALVADTEDFLKQLMDLRDDGLFSNARVTPLDRPNLNDNYYFDVDNFEFSLQTSIERALERRPEMHIAALDIEMAELEEFRRRREMLPQVDITASYSQAGRDRSRTTTIEKMTEADDHIYSYGVIASVPIGNRAARGAHERARIQRRQSELRERQTEQQMAMNVRMAARSVLTNSVLVESNERARQLQEANVIAEQRRLQLGTTTSYQVLQIMEDLTLAQTQEVQAQIAYENALVDLQLAEGTLLENLGIAFENPSDIESTGYFESINPFNQ